MKFDVKNLNKMASKQQPFCQSTTRAKISLLENNLYTCGLCQSQLHAFEIDSHLKSHLSVCSKYVLDDKTRILVPQLENTECVIEQVNLKPLPAEHRHPGNSTEDYRAADYIHIQTKADLTSPSEHIATSNYHEKYISSPKSMPQKVQTLKSILPLNMLKRDLKNDIYADLTVSNDLSSSSMVTNKNVTKNNTNEGTILTKKFDLENVTSTKVTKNSNFKGEPFSVGDVITRVQVPCTRDDIRLGVYECSVIVDQFIPCEDFAPENLRNSDNLEGVDYIKLDINFTSEQDENLDFFDDLPDGIFDNENEDNSVCTSPLKRPLIDETLDYTYTATPFDQNKIKTQQIPIKYHGVESSTQNHRVTYMPETQNNDPRPDNDMTTEEKEEMDRELKKEARRIRKREQMRIKRATAKGEGYVRRIRKKTLLYGLQNKDMAMLFKNELKKVMLSEVRKEIALAKYVDCIPKAIQDTLADEFEEETFGWDEYEHVNQEIISCDIDRVISGNKLSEQKDAIQSAADPVKEMQQACVDTEVSEDTMDVDGSYDSGRIETDEQDVDNPNFKVFHDHKFYCKKTTTQECLDTLKEKEQESETVIQEHNGTSAKQRKKKQCNDSSLHTIDAQEIINEGKRYKRNNTFFCMDCGKSARTEQGYFRHKAYLCKVTRITKKGNDPQKRTWHCEHCDGMFVTENQMLVHKRCCRSRPMLKCEVCGFESQSDISMSKHKSKSHGMKMHVCDQCGRQLSSPYQLKQHFERSHMNKTPQEKRMMRQAQQKKFTCEECGLSYLNSVRLKTHIEKEHERLLFKCRQCGAEFKTRQNCVVHERNHKNKVVYAYFCITCQFDYKKRKAYVKHMKQNHKIEEAAALELAKQTVLLMERLNPNMCSICRQVFTLDSAYFNHMMVKHKVSRLDAVKEREKIIQERKCQHLGIKMNIVQYNESEKATQWVERHIA